MSENIEGTNGTAAPAEQKPEAHEPKAKKSKAHKAPKAEQSHEVKIVRLDTGKDYGKLHLPKDENDPHWDPRMEQEVPEGLIESMVERELQTTIQVEEAEDGGYDIDDGRTRVRAIPEVNRRRKRLGKPPFVLTLAVRPHREESIDSDRDVVETAIMSNVRLDSPPTVQAAEISRALAADVSEEWLCKKLGMTSQKLHAMLGLLDLPKGVQKHVDDGTISITAALALTKLDESKVQAAADSLAAAAKVGKKVTAKDVARVSGNEEKVATRGQIKQWLLDAQSYKLAGKHGEAAKWAAIVAIEVCLGTRSIDQAVAALDRISKGEAVKVNFAQYQKD